MYTRYKYIIYVYFRCVCTCTMYNIYFERRYFTFNVRGLCNCYVTFSFSFFPSDSRANAPHTISVATCQKEKRLCIASRILSDDIFRRGATHAKKEHYTIFS